MAKPKQKSVKGKKKNETDPKKVSSTANKSTAQTEGFPTHLLQSPKKKSPPPQPLDILVPGAVFASRNFLTPSECKAWVCYSEQVGFESLDSPQTYEYAHRKCGRISRNDWSMSAALFHRMKGLVQQVASQVEVGHYDASYGPVTCNGNLRLYKYDPHMSFGRHYDGSQSIKEYPNGNTEITVLIYLSSCIGGATRFHLPHSTKKKKRKSEESEVAFVPEQGAILLHMHGDRCLEHEADPVEEGVKYILRTDIVYATQKTE